MGAPPRRGDRLHGVRSRLRLAGRIVDRSRLTAWWRHSRGVFSPPIVAILVVVILGYGAGLWVLQRQIDDRTRLDRQDCALRVETRTVIRELLIIRIESTPADPAVPRYEALLHDLSLVPECAA